MPIIDSQVHAYEANTPKRPWHSVPNWPPHVTGDEMVAAMDKVGVDGAIFISAFSLYQYDASYAVEVQRKHPGRLAIIKPVDPDDPAVGEVIAEWKKQPGAVAMRIMMRDGEPARAGRSRLDRIARAAARHGLPVNVLFWGNLDEGTRSSIAIPTRASSSTIWASCSRAPARAGAALGRPAEGARARQAPQRGDQGERRLHALQGALSVPRHLGSARSACSMPGASSAACGARTGRAPSRW